MRKKLTPRKELERMIELLDEAIADGQMAEIEQEDRQKEYKRRFGKEYAY